MIIEKQKQSLVKSLGVTDSSINMSLDMDSAQILMQMLSKNLYSDPIGSTIRETCSNALDSHRRINSKDPIIVSLNKNEYDQYEFTVEDFGSGLSQDEVYDTLSKYGKSTKRNSKKELGCFGLGFKSPLSYIDTFYFITRKDGVECKFMMYENEFSNSIDLMFSQETTEKNGVKIIVPVNYNDYYSFLKSIKTQLAYFEDVYFNTITINNDFKIIRKKDFQYSEMCEDNYLHICLDNVYYPIDFKKLNIAPIYCNIGLRFSLTDGIVPTPSREAILYSPETVKIILKKIEKISTYIVEDYNNRPKDLRDMIKYQKNQNKLPVIINNVTFDFFQFVQYSKVSFIEPNLDFLINLDFYKIYYDIRYLNEYSIKYKITNSVFTTKKTSSNDYLIDNLVNSKNKLFLIDKEEPTTLQKKYLKSLYNDDVLFFTKKQISLFPKKNKLNYFKLLSLHIFPKNKWREVIVEYQQLVKLITKDFIKIEDFIVPADFNNKVIQKIKATSVTNKKYFTNEEIECRLATDLAHSSYNKYYKLIPSKININKVGKSNHFYVYLSHDIDYLKHNLYDYFTSLYKNIRFITLKEKELLKIKKLKNNNLITINEFMQGNTKFFRKAGTAIIIKEFIKENNQIFKNLEVIKEVNTNLYNNLINLEKYVNKYYKYSDNMLKESMESIITNNNLYDFNIYYDFLNVKKDINNIDFMKPFSTLLYSNVRYPSEECLEVLVMLFKYKKQRVNLKYYNLVKNE